MPSEPTAGRQKRCAIVGAPPKRINLLDVPGEFDRNCYTVETRGGRNGFPAAGESCPRSFQPRPAACTRSGGDGYAEVSRTADRKSTRLDSSHVRISYAVFCLK